MTTRHSNHTSAPRLWNFTTASTMLPTLQAQTRLSRSWLKFNSQGRPAGELAAAIDEFFGSFEKFQAHFNAAAMGLQGSGWAFLAWDAVGSRLIIEQLYDQQGNVPVATIPLLMLDMWEHAFYLDYKNVKADYVKAFWNIINWDDVAARFDAARAGTASVLLFS